MSIIDGRWSGFPSPSLFALAYTPFLIFPFSYDVRLVDHYHTSMEPCTIVSTSDDILTCGYIHDGCFELHALQLERSFPVEPGVAERSIWS